VRRAPFLLVLLLLLVAAIFYTARRGEHATLSLRPTTDSLPPQAPIPAGTLENSQTSSAMGLGQSARTDSTRVEVQPQVDPGPCRIDGVVLRRSGKVDTPLADVEVLLEEDKNPGEFIPTVGATKPAYLVLSRTRSDSNGTWTFDRIAGKDRNSLGIQYRVSARLLDGTERDSLVQVSEQYPNGRADLVFGCARIRGTLRSIHGEPLESACVRLKTADYSVHAVESIWRATDAAGAYSFEALGGGTYSILVLAPKERAPMAAWPGRWYVVQLGEGEDLRLDAGTSGDSPTWRGMIRSSTGAVLTGDMSLGLESTTRFPLGSEVKTILSYSVDGEHGFDLSLDAAEWTPRLSCHGRSPWAGNTWTAQAPVHVPPEGLVQDLVPGHHLIGRIRVEGTDQDLQGYGSAKVHVYLHRLDKSTAERETTIDDQGAFVFEMVNEGSWFARISPLKLAGESWRVPFEITASEPVHKLDLEVRKP
jgi:hypothetical protein